MRVGVVNRDKLACNLQPNNIYIFQIIVICSKTIFISSIFSFLIFTISFFLLQLSISFINITPIEFLIKPFLVNKIDGYDNSFSEAVLYIDTDSKKTIAKIKIDLTNKVKSEQFQLSSEFETNLVDIINFDYNYSFSSSLINKNIKFTKKNNY